jgi:predicted DCC family thiol-disulfide oxidoreductase YuxK
MITVFYDGNCPLCCKEMDMLRGYDTASKLCLEDIHADDFSQRYPQIDVSKAMQILHGLNRDGQVMLGLDVTVAAWRAVGKKRWLGVLRWPFVSWFADKAYLFFAKHRMRISAMMMGAPVCELDRLDTSPTNQVTGSSARNCLRSVDEGAEF